MPRWVTSGPRHRNGEIRIAHRRLQRCRPYRCLKTRALDHTAIHFETGSYGKPNSERYNSIFYRALYERPLICDVTLHRASSDGACPKRRMAGEKLLARGGIHLAPLIGVHA
jgi:hypothetical protein